MTWVSYVELVVPAVGGPAGHDQHGVYVFGNRVAEGELDRVYQGKRESDHRTSE